MVFPHPPALDLPAAGRLGSSSQHRRHVEADGERQGSERPEVSIHTRTLHLTDGTLGQAASVCDGLLRKVQVAALATKRTTECDP